MSDSFGDGMCCTEGLGSYRVLSDGQVIASGGEFGFDEVTEFGNTCDDGEPEPTECLVGTAEFKALINTDNFGRETSWTLQAGSGAIIHSGSRFNSNDSIEASHYIPTDDCCTFTISDSASDGLCCGYGVGSFSVMWRGSEVGSGGEFRSRDDVKFGSCPDGQNHRATVADGNTIAQKSHKQK